MARPDYYGNPAGLVDEIEVVRGLYDAFERRDLDAMLDGISDDAELFFEGTARLAGRTEPYRGHDGLRDYLADVERVWEELVLHASDYRAVPGSVIVLGHVSAVRGGEPMQRAIVWTWRLRGGLATSVRVSDMGELA